MASSARITGSRGSPTCLIAGADPPSLEPSGVGGAQSEPMRCHVGLGQGLASCRSLPCVYLRVQGFMFLLCCGVASMYRTLLFDTSYVDQAHGRGYVNAFEQLEAGLWKMSIWAHSLRPLQSSCCRACECEPAACKLSDSLQMPSRPNLAARERMTEHSQRLKAREQSLRQDAERARQAGHGGASTQASHPVVLGANSCDYFGCVLERLHG